MRLALVALKNVSDVNNFDEVAELRVTDGNPFTLYLRLVDLDQPVRGNTDSGYLRKIPDAGATMSLALQQMDSSAIVTKVATQPFSADDRSIWAATILATDKLFFNNINAVLTMGGNQYKLPIVSSIVSDPSGTGRFFC